MLIKRHLENVVELCAGDNEFAAEAIEVALIMGWVILGYENLQRDALIVMCRYDDIIEAYREWRGQNPEVSLAA